MSVGDGNEVETPGKKMLRLTYQLNGQDEALESESDTVVIGRANDADLQIRH